MGFYQGCGKRGVVLAMLCFAGLFAFLALFLGAGREVRAAGNAVADLPAGGCEVLLFAGSGERTWLVYSGAREAAVLALEAPSGTEEYRADFSGPLAWAALRGGSLFVCEESWNSLCLTRLSASLEQEARYEYPLNPFELVWSDCTAEGSLYAVKSGARDVLTLYSPDGGETSRRFSGEVEFLRATPGGRLYLYAGAVLYRSENGSLGGLRPVFCQAPPFLLLGEDAYLDLDGMACRIRAGEAEAAFHCPTPLNGPLLYCGREESGVILGDGENRVRFLPWDGSAGEDYSVEGSLLAVAQQGSLVRREGKLWYIPHTFAGMEPVPSAEPSPSPAPSVSPAPSASPDPGDGPAWKPVLRDEFLIVPVGATVEELLQLFRPASVLVQTPAGETVVSGRLCTGMTAGRYTLVVQGDCNGTGTVNSADLRTAQAHVLGKAGLGRGAYFLAADLDGDGEVTAADLVLVGALALW